MKIGLSTWAYPAFCAARQKEAALRLIERAAELRAEVFQFADNLPLDGLSAKELERLRLSAQENGIAPEVGTAGLSPENLMRHLAVAKSLGATLVRTLPHSRESRPGLLEAQGMIGRVIKEYESAGVTLAVENHDHYPAAWFSKLIESVKSPFLGVCLDAVNSLGQGEGFSEVIGALARHTVNFHCKDYTIRRRADSMGFVVSGTQTGRGMLDLDTAKNRLSGGISWIVESWLPDEDNAKMQQTEQIWARESLAYLFRFRREKCGI
ncbi:MAG: sugar phosphate isomerase/epimerase [Clostridiales bacterium]|nr:sugar phosphate isomerase/epimerase [Clostridiales bacterium]